jgi:hypothetical protein
MMHAEIFHHLALSRSLEWMLNATQVFDKIHLRRRLNHHTYLTNNRDLIETILHATSHERYTRVELTKQWQAQALSCQGTYLLPVTLY